MSSETFKELQAELNEKLKVSRLEDRQRILRKALYLRNLQLLRINLMEFYSTSKAAFEKLKHETKDGHVPVEANEGKRITDAYQQDYFLWAATLRDLILDELDESYDPDADSDFEEVEPTSATKTLDLLYRRIARLGVLESFLMRRAGLSS